MDDEKVNLHISHTNKELFNKISKLIGYRVSILRTDDPGFPYRIFSQKQLEMVDEIS